MTLRITWTYRLHATGLLQEIFQAEDPVCVHGVELVDSCLVLLSNRAYLRQEL